MGSGADRIYFLSDGEPDSSTEAILREVGNSERKIPVNSIAFFATGAAADFMEKLARSTKGTYRAVTG